MTDNSTDNEEETSLDYCIKLKIFVKEFSSQQNRGAQELDQTTISCSNQLDFKEKLWTRISRYVSNAAIISESQISAQKEDPTLEDISMGEPASKKEATILKLELKLGSRV